MKCEPEVANGRSWRIRARQSSGQLVVVLLVPQVAGFGPRTEGKFQHQHQPQANAKREKVSRTSLARSYATQTPTLKGAPRVRLIGSRARWLKNHRRRRH